MENDNLQILTDRVKAHFDAHLSEMKAGARFFFSGKFGSGKTTFLKEYYKDDKNVIHLYPVNYSVANNEDIFELIKRDILIQLLENVDDSFFDSEEFTLALRTYTFLSQEGGNMLEDIIKFSFKNGAKFLKILKKIRDNHEKFKKVEKNLNKPTIKEFVNEFCKKGGSIYEMDAISMLISKAVKTLPNATLIIDDLDRIDPAHIFRILNVFSAHFDINGIADENKFGFTKIILVADMDNIHNIFKYKYGTETDFNGYINKFYNYPNFNFDLNYELGNYVYKIAQGLIKKHENYFDLVELGQFSQVEKFLSLLLFLAVKQNILQIRTMNSKDKINLNKNMLIAQNRAIVSYLGIVGAFQLFLKLLNIRPHNLAQYFEGNATNFEIEYISVHYELALNAMLGIASGTYKQKNVGANLEKVYEHSNGEKLEFKIHQNGRKVNAEATWNGISSNLLFGLIRDTIKNLQAENALGV